MSVFLKTFLGMTRSGRVRQLDIGTRFEFRVLQYRNDMILAGKRRNCWLNVDEFSTVYIWDDGLDGSLKLGEYSSTIPQAASALRS
jgi:hypothetical protein